MRICAHWKKILFHGKIIPNFSTIAFRFQNVLMMETRNEQTKIVEKVGIYFFVKTCLKLDLFIGFVCLIRFIYQLIVNALMRVKIEFFRQKHYGKISSNDQCRFPDFYWTLHSCEVFLSNCVLWLEVLSQNGLKCFGRTYVFPPIFVAFSSFPQFWPHI